MCKCLWNMCASEHCMGSWKLCTYTSLLWHLSIGCAWVVEDSTLAACLEICFWISYLFLLSQTVPSCPPLKVLEAHAHMVFLVLCFDLSDCIFVKNIYSYAMWVSQLLPIAARLEPYAVTTVSHCILIFHSVSTFSVLVRYKKNLNLYRII